MSAHWDKHSTWEDAEKSWDMRSSELQQSQPIKQLVKIPKLPGIRPKTKKNLRWKAMNYLAKYDEEKFFIKYFFSKPIRHGFNLLRSYLTTLPYIRDDDFFLYLSLIHISEPTRPY